MTDKQKTAIERPGIGMFQTEETSWHKGLTYLKPEKKIIVNEAE